MSLEQKIDYLHPISFLIAVCVYSSAILMIFGWITFIFLVSECFHRTLHRCIIKTKERSFKIGWKRERQE